MVVRPESPVNVASAQEDWFREYMWMNDSEKFDEEYLEELFHQDPRDPSTSSQSHSSHPPHDSPPPHDSSPHDSPPQDLSQSQHDSPPHQHDSPPHDNFNNEELDELLQHGLNRVVEELESEPSNGTSTDQARPSPVEVTPEILTKSKLNPDAQEFVPSSPPSR